MNDLPEDMLPEDMEAARVGASKKEAPEGAVNLLNVGPKLSSDDFANNGSGYSKGSGYGCVTSTIGPDGADKIGVEFYVWVALAWWRNVAMPAFCHHIHSVLMHGSGTKMLWIDASRVIAGVHQHNVIWQRLAVMKHVCDAVSKAWLALVGKATVTKLVSSANPLNAVRGFRLFAFLKEPALKGCTVPALLDLVGVAGAKQSPVVNVAKAFGLNRRGAADGASAHIQPPIVEARVMKLLGSLHGNRFSAAKPSQAESF